MAHKSKKRGNVLDVFLILLLLLSAAGVLLRWYTLRERESGEETVHVTLLVSALHAQSADCLDSGEILYEADGSPWGEIVEIQRGATPVTLEEDGVVYHGTYGEEKCDLVITVKVYGEWHGEWFLKGGRDAVLIGQTREVYSMRMQLLAQVTNVTKQDLKN